MTYEIEITPAAQRQIKKLPPDVREQIIQCLDALKLDPRPAGVRKMSGEEGLYRVRVSDYRVIYEIKDKKLLICVTKAAHRREVYKK